MVSWRQFPLSGESVVEAETERKEEAGFHCMQDCCGENMLAGATKDLDSCCG